MRTSSYRSPRRPTARRPPSAGLTKALQDLLGRAVDLVNLDAITNPDVLASINRSRQVIYELRPATVSEPAEKAATLERFLAHRIKPAPGAPTSVKLLNLIYDEPNE